MKRLIAKPGFEALFSAGIIVMLAVPQLLFAQKHKDVKIIIRDNDTTYNGKHLKDLAPDERQEAIAEIGKMNGRQEPRFRDGANLRFRRYNERRDTLFVKDSLHAMNREMPRMELFRHKMDRDMDETFRRGPEGPMMGRMDDRFNFRRGPGMPMMNFDRRNSQNFNYSSTDKNGIATHINYHVTDAGPQAAKHIANLTKIDLELTDILLIPQFTAGKTTLSFALSAKASAEVRLTDSEGKTIWKDKALQGYFSKTFSINLNGMYYLVVNQGAKAAVKRIIKE